MDSVWGSLEAIPGPAAVAAVWKPWLGGDLECFRDAFLRRKPEPARSYPCPHGCGCAHDVVRHSDGTIVGVCQCDPPDCEDLALTADGLVVYELDRQRLGRAIARALGCHARTADLGIPDTSQVGAYSDRAVPVVLTVVGQAALFRQVVSEPAARLRGRFILLAPTAGFMDVGCQEVLNHVAAGFLALDRCLVLTPQGNLQPTEPVGDLLAPFAPTSQGGVTDAVAAQVFRLVVQLDQDRRLKHPSLLTVFRLYCVYEMPSEAIARKCRCAKGTVINRMRELCRRLGRSSLHELRAYAPTFRREEEALRDPRARRISRRAAIYGDDPDHDDKD